MKVYLDQILSRIPQIISQIDRESFSSTYGCGDRVYWCWKFTDFPGARFQENIYTLSWLYTADSFDNPWKGNKNILDMIHAGLMYWSKIQVSDGSFNEAYPFEHSLAATAFTVFYLTEGFDLVKNELDEETKKTFLNTLNKACIWLCRNDEKHGILSNHLAAAAAGLYNGGLLLKNTKFTERAWYFVKRIYTHQSSEGWYEEYGGADIGYQTHASFYLARIWQKSEDDELFASLKKANGFLKFFIHPDGSLGGEYASRNTMFYYPAAFEMLANTCSDTASIAFFQRENIEKQKTVGLEQMDAYNLFPVLNNYIFAYENCCRENISEQIEPLPFEQSGSWDFIEAGLIVKSTSHYYAVIGGKKGGVIRIWDKKTNKLAWQSSGYILQIGKKWYSNQAQGLSSYTLSEKEMKIDAPFVAINQKIFTPWLFMIFRIFTLTTGRIPVLAYAIKDLLVKVLVRNKKMNKDILFRSIFFSNEMISIEDTLSDKDMKVKHLDKFSTIHMGSSRYAHMEEEQVRGVNNKYAEVYFNQNGVIIKSKVRFL